MPISRNGLNLFALLMVLVLSFQSYAAEIYVAVTGSDRNEGTREKPLATIAMALRKARELRRLNHPSVTPGIKIIVAGGVYRLEEPIFIRPEDSGTNTSPTIIEAAPGESPMISGGITLNNWQKLTERINDLAGEVTCKIWTTESALDDIRQLWINDAKAIRARESDGDSMDRILSWDHSNETCRIPIPGYSGFRFTEGMEMVIHQWWAVAFLRIRAVSMKEGAAELSFKQPESRIQSEHPWPAPWISKETGNSAFYLVNALQFLDQPGEFYFDNKLKRVYYYPRSNEDMKSATITAPLLETLVKIEGVAEKPVTNIYFKGISFQHAGWFRPSRQGHVPHQAGMFMLDAYKLEVPGTPDKKTLENQAWVGRPAATVQLNYTKHTGFENCRFVHLASTGLDYHKGNQHALIEGNLFRDIGGTAILAGNFSDESMEVHLPYNPADEREITRELRITNNMITDVTNEDWGCVGVGAGYVRDVTIDHNEICEVSYTGISLGWGWTKTSNVMRNNRIIANKIHHYARHMYDVAGIYTLSAQPGTVISGNYIDSIYVAKYAHIPSHWFYLYTDEGSSYITVKDNWCPSEKFLQNANGPGNLWENNGPGASRSIREKAGIETKFKYLLKEKVVRGQRPINHFNPAQTSLKQ
ncbi:MAG TPA: right-handed parallel beta-helix repeat-containing protein [Chitinophagaceae bacterium]